MHDGTQEVDTPPEPLGQLIGRDEVVEQVAQLMFRPDVRLVTLTGRSGVGKTVVAREVARVIGHEDGLDIPRVQVDRHGRRTGLDEVAAVVSMSADGPAGMAPSGRRRLVLLDGLEAAPGVAAVVSEGLAADPDLTVLATSIVPLSLPEEHVVPLDPLLAPSPEVVLADGLRGAPAVQLLLARIDEVAPAAARTADVRSAATLAHLLGGLPLSLELAAARCAERSLDEVLDQFQRLDPVELLSSGTAATGAHHSSLRATILWTYQLLSPDQQLSLRRLGVFAGPFTRDTAVAVAGGVATDGLDAIVATGLARPSWRGPAGERFELVPSVSLIARELLDAEGGLADVEDRHAAHFLDLARAAAVELRSPATPEVRRRLLDDREEFVAAVRCLERRDRRNDALRLMTDLALLWEESEEAALAVTLLGRLLPTPADGDGRDPATNDPATTAQGWALAAMASIWAKGQFERSDELPAALVHAEEIAHRSGSTVALLMVLRSRVASSLAVGDSQDAVHGAAEGLAIARARRELWWVNQFLAWSAAAHTMAGDRDAAMAFAVEGRDLALRQGDVAQVLRASHILIGAAGPTAGPDPEGLTEDELLVLARRVGDVHAEGVLRVGAAVRSVAAGDTAGAGGHLLEALRLGHRRGLWYVEELAVLALVVVATAGGCTPEAARLHGAMSPMLAGLSRAIAPEAMQLYEFAVGQARTQLGDATFERETGRGRLLAWDDASALAAQVCDVLSTADADSEVTPAGDHMTPRQAQVLSLLATGRTNKEIAVQLGLRPKTVMHYTSELYRRLGVRNRTEAVAEARRLGLLATDG